MEAEGGITLGAALPFAWVNLLCASLLTYCLGRIHEKKDALEQNRLLIE